MSCRFQVHGVGVGLLVAAAVGFAAPHANAYCRTHTCQADKSCEDDAQQCPVGGKPLYWPRRCISFSVQQDGSPYRGISPEDAESVLETAYATWTQARCSDTRNPSIDVFKLDRVACGEIEFNECDRNANIWVFRDDGWPYDDGGRTLAQTWVHFDTRSGKIYDADVEVNTTEFEITTTNPELFTAIATHEIGHVFGLDHSPFEDATMFALYGSDISELTADDVAGICEIYPSDRDVVECNPEPYNGFSAVCGSVECEDGGCCATTPGRDSRHGGVAALLAGLAVVLVRVRRAGRRR